jgi:4-carboxymuconolactone decarboxylase
MRGGGLGRGLSTAPDLEEEAPVDYVERLRRLSINDEEAVDMEIAISESGGRVTAVDPKTLALARVAALVAIGASDPSFGSQVDAAVSTGASAAEIVDVLVGVASVVGIPRVVAAAPRVALALGYEFFDSDNDAALR